MHLAGVGLAEVLPDAAAISQDDVAVGLKLACQQGPTTVLVDDRLQALVGARVAHARHRDAATAAHDGQGAVGFLYGQQGTHAVDLQDLLWPRRSDHPPEVLAIRLGGPAQRLGQRVGLHGAVHRPHKLCGVLEGLVLRVDLDLRQHRDCRDVDAGQGLAEDVADLALRLGSQHVEGRGGALERQLAHLRPVPVGEDKLAGLHELLQHRRCVVPRRLQLVLDGQPLPATDQGVAADRHHDPRLLGRGLRGAEAELAPELQAQGPGRRREHEPAGHHVASRVLGTAPPMSEQKLQRRA
mmetsp:Transcript_38339/g.69471  ORF Transcript_38339/g.69471 Transcript_38339/m.69471 type:complete len:297 (+) Transcript_38339:688-1578(+)